jgi:hypothetical protein
MVTLEAFSLSTRLIFKTAPSPANSFHQFEQPMNAILKTIELLQNSNDSPFAHSSVVEVSAILQDLQLQIEQTSLADKTKLDFLFAPTGSLQEIAIHNGWGNEFLSLAAEIDKITQ